MVWNYRVCRNLNPDKDDERYKYEFSTFEVYYLRNNSKYGNASTVNPVEVHSNTYKWFLASTLQALSQPIIDLTMNEEEFEENGKKFKEIPDLMPKEFYKDIKKLMDKYKLDVHKGEEYDHEEM